MVQCSVYSCCYTLVSSCFFCILMDSPSLFFMNSCIEYKEKNTLLSYKHQIPTTFSVISVALAGSLANVTTHTSESRRAFFSVAPHLGYALPYPELLVISQKKERARSSHNAFGPTGAPLTTGNSRQSKAFILQPLGVGLMMSWRGRRRKQPLVQLLLPSL